MGHINVNLCFFAGRSVPISIFSPTSLLWMCNPGQMQRTHVVRFDLRSLMFSMPCLTVLAQDLCYSDPLSLVLTFLTHTMAVRILSLVAALPSLCMLCMPLMFRSQQPQKNSHQSTSETQTQTQTRRHADTQTHRHTDTQTHRRTDTQSRGEPWRPPPSPCCFQCVDQTH